MLSAILQSHRYNEKDHININEHIDNPPPFRQYSDTTFNKWQPKTIKYKAINIPKTSEESWDNIQPFKMLNVPDSFVELGYSNIKPIEKTDDLYYQYDLKNYDQQKDIIYKWQRETGELVDKESEMNANIIDKSAFMDEYNKQFNADVEGPTTRSKFKKTIPIQKQQEKKIRVEKATMDHLLSQQPHNRIEYEQALRKPGKATTTEVKIHNADTRNNKMPYGILKKNLLKKSNIVKDVYEQQAREAIHKKARAINDIEEGKFNLGSNKYARKHILKDIRKHKFKEKEPPLEQSGLEDRIENDPQPEIEATKEDEPKLKTEGKKEILPKIEDLKNMTDKHLLHLIKEYGTVTSKDKKTSKGQKAHLIKHMTDIINKMV